MERRSDGTEPVPGPVRADPVSLGGLFPAVYEELRRLARRHLRHEPSDNTVTTTALVHDAYLRLIDQRQVDWGNRALFMATAATSMRRILVDHARSRRSPRRGGALVRVTFDDVDIAAEDHAELLLAVDDALDQLADFDARQAQVVECRFFGGLTEVETAEAIGVSLRTVKRDWAKARSWLYQAISPDAVE
jgi:RNA polymerase sigma factor (TIGR02999 family)